MAALTSAGPWRAGQETWRAAAVYAPLTPRAVIAAPVSAAAATAATTTAVPVAPSFTRYPVLP